MSYGGKMSYSHSQNCDVYLHPRDMLFTQTATEANKTKKQA